MSTPEAAGVNGSPPVPPKNVVKAA